MKIQHIELSKLKPSQWNVRKTGGKDVSELAASIKSVGLLQNLTVNAGENCFYVINGGRRLAALLDLWRSGNLTADFLVPCNVIDPIETDLIEASLAENTIREAMHPADQFDAFKALHSSGEHFPIADIAARFGVSETIVKQRLKLANVSPKLLAEYRAGNATLEQMQALAISDDHTAQEAAWAAGEDREWLRNTDHLRRALTEKEVSSNDSRVKFVDVDAYELAGGVVRRDLFGDDVYVEDVKLLERLVSEKLAETANALKAEGWAFVEVHQSMDWEQRHAYKNAYYPKNRAYTKEEQMRVKKFEARQAELAELMEDAEGDEWQKLNKEDDSIIESLREIEEAIQFFTEAAKADSGVLVFLDRTGLNIDRGIQRPGQKSSNAKTSNDTSSESIKKPFGLGQTAIDKLYGERTAIIRANISAEAAICALVAAMAYEFTQRPHAFTPIRANTQNSMSPAMREAAETCTAGSVLKMLETHFQSRIAKTEGEIFEWLLKQNRETVLEFLAFFSQKAIVVRDDGEAFARLVGVDVAAHWAVTEEWLAQQPKGYIIEAVNEACGKKAIVGLDKMKSAEVAKHAAPLLLEKGWLPEQLREPKPKAKKDRKQLAANDTDGDDD